ncbi:BrnA antitoxin family protein [Neorhizobium petrolearium]|uniref:BrnA antitoxin family protein n=1 Tax=Neorhizobium petrolearium TaxID=515361 RepID=UPI003F5CE043
MTTGKGKAVLYDGVVYERRPDGSLVPFEDKTDYARLDAMTDEEIEAIAAADEDGPPMSDEEWARAVSIPVKVPVGIKLDSDVLDWFKSGGRGYQTRMNAVLRRYMETHRKAG